MGTRHWIRSESVAVLSNSVLCSLLQRTGHVHEYVMVPGEVGGDEGRARGGGNVANARRCWREAEAIVLIMHRNGEKGAAFALKSSVLTYFRCLLI